VLLFVAFWLVLGLGVFFLGIRSGPKAAYRRATYAARRAWGLVIVVVYIGFGVVLPVLFLTGNHSNASAQVGGITLNTAEKRGREIFGERCALCHTLAAANAVGKVGPNLDVIKPTQQLVEHTIMYGCLQNPPSGSQEACLGEGTMPAQVVEGVDATDVAKFVSKVAGNE
jgi:cytochrome c5